MILSRIICKKKEFLHVNIRINSLDDYLRQYNKKKKQNTSLSNVALFKTLLKVNENKNKKCNSDRIGIDF